MKNYYKTLKKIIVKNIQKAKRSNSINRVDRGVDPNIS